MLTKKLSVIAKCDFEGCRESYACPSPKFSDAVKLLKKEGWWIFTEGKVLCPTHSNPQLKSLEIKEKVLPFSEMILSRYDRQ